MVEHDLSLAYSFSLLRINYCTIETMLQGLAGFIFGKAPSAESTEIPAGRDDRRSDNDIKNAINEEASSEPLQKEMVDVVSGEDEEWLVVDIRGDENVSEFAGATSGLHEFDLVLPSSGESSPSADERGWNLTPPPCFAASFQREHRLAAGFIPVLEAKRKPVVEVSKQVIRREEDALNSVLETSNFENLLIEHPSMSVYGRIMPPSQRGPASIMVATQGNQPVQTRVTQPLPPPLPKSTKRKEPAAAATPAGLPPTMEAVLGTDYVAVVSRWLDLEKQQRAERASKAKEFNANRARLMNAVGNTPHGNGSPRRRRMKNHPAGRCNDRKCQ